MNNNAQQYQSERAHSCEPIFSTENQRCLSRQHAPSAIGHLNYHLQELETVPRSFELSLDQDDLRSSCYRNDNLTHIRQKACAVQKLTKLHRIDEQTALWK